jgi:P27 family predicted phage terminase small subunit
MGGPGSGGHNKKPIDFHKRAGTYRKDRHKTEIDWSLVPPAQVRPPRRFTKDARRFWREHRDICEELGTLDALTQPLFEVLCELWSTIREFDRRIQEDGMIIGNKAHPLVAPKNRAVRDFGQLSREFGLSPARRPRIGIPGPAKQSDDPFDEFIEEKDKR